jgi:hypothetical protein
MKKGLVIVAGLVIAIMMVGAGGCEYVFVGRYGNFAGNSK